LSKEILSHVPCQLLRALIVSSDKNTTGTCLFYLLFLGDLFSPGKPDIYFRHALPFNKNEICKHAVTRMKVVHYFRQCPWLALPIIRVVVVVSVVCTFAGCLSTWVRFSCISTWSAGRAHHVR
jgi:hypothetical protein